MRIKLETTEKMCFNPMDKLSTLRAREVSVRMHFDNPSVSDVIMELFIPALKAFGYEEKDILAALNGSECYSG